MSEVLRHPRARYGPLALGRVRVGGCGARARAARAAPPGNWFRAAGRPYPISWLVIGRVSPFYRQPLQRAYERVRVATVVIATQTPGPQLRSEPVARAESASAVQCSECVRTGQSCLASPSPMVYGSAAQSRHIGHGKSCAAGARAHPLAHCGPGRRDASYFPVPNADRGRRGNAR